MKKTKKHKSNSEKVRELSNHQKELKHKINSLNEKHEIRECGRERNKVMKELHREIEMEKCRNIDDECSRIEKIGDDSKCMFITLRILNSYKPKQRLIININEG